MMSEGHTSEEVLEEYSRGTLPDAEAAVVEEHLLICPQCQGRLAEIDAFVDATRQAASRLQMSPPTTWEEIWHGLWRWLTRRPAPLAAATALAVLLAIVAIAWRVGNRDEPAFSVYLQAVRGGETLLNVRAPLGRPLLLELDPVGLPVLPSYRLEIVDARGAAVFEATARHHATAITVEVARRLSAGAYWIRLYEPHPSRTLLREFGLLID